jgi:alanine-glyoxylate transaminase/serine-glyoxylate transaminase/serine-pyruvate transaminase
MDHRGPDFGVLGTEILGNLRAIFQTEGPVIIYPASGTGAWEAALTNTLSPGDTVLMCRTGWFAHLWKEMAERLQLNPIFLDTDWRRGADVPALAQALTADTSHRIKAVCVVHNETSTGCASRIDEVRAAMDAAGHPALLLVDTISSLASIDYRHDEWGVDVTVAGSQKGLMLPPGLSFNAISAKALAATEAARLPRSYWDWRPMLEANKTGYFPYTPGTNLLYGLNEAVKMLLEEGLPNVFARHDRFAEATRRAVRAWGLEVQCADPRHYSSSLTAVRMPEGHSADGLRATILARFNMSLGNGLGILKDRVFRIGHLGDLGDLQLIGTLGGVEMGLRAAGVPHRSGGVQAAIDYLSGNA